ncbi:MAG TPA: malto-oligosyltrehalose trehalohydrolase [Planctomycetota bacterium]|nr:malto-oligosyltrehalose trehalohydrolase [Planctomycetota bacterium]
MKAGARYLGKNRCEFTLWAPLPETVDLVILTPKERAVTMTRDDCRYWRATADGVAPGTLYSYRLNGKTLRPDPASHSQPEGVHGPSLVVDHAAFEWGDRTWAGIPFDRMIIYEIHTGTFTAEGTFSAIIPRLEELAKLGVTAVELMPVAQFPGSRNWGYDGAYPYAVQTSYGGPTALKRLVDACHRHGLAAVLDVVYNHLGPEGCYLLEFGPYFTETYLTPWGKALNYDEHDSDQVRDFFIENALHWFQHYHFDALRLDAVDYIINSSAKPFLQELAERTDAFCRHTGRKHYLTAEMDLNDNRYVAPVENGGYGIDVQWCDDFHHALFGVLTGYSRCYYSDFGTIEQLAKSLRGGYVYTWEYSPFRRRHRGSSPDRIRADQLVVFAQNHDQVGNRVAAERLAVQVPFDALKLAAAAYLLSPYVPLIFMGEEYAEDAPFFYFISHEDPQLVDAVRAGYRKGLKAFHDPGEPVDPFSEQTFLRSKLHWDLRARGRHRVLLQWYRTLLRLRKEMPAFAHLDKRCTEVTAHEEHRLIIMRRWHNGSHAACLLNFSERESALELDLPEGSWTKLLDSSEDVWQGPGVTVPTLIHGGQRVAIPPLTAVVLGRR